MKHKVRTFLKWPVWVEFHGDIGLPLNAPWIFHSGKVLWIGRLSIAPYRVG
jgi:hypothetical protein